ncbi:MAG: hypothetical protein V3S55_03885 [Nitrospiraceae bacterium]
MIKLFTSLVLIVGLSGCLGAGLSPVTPESPREKLVAAEAAYEFALLEVRSLIVNGIIVPKSNLAGTVAFLIIETRKALDVWQTSPDNPNYHLAAITALSGLQAELAKHVVTRGAGRPIAYHLMGAPA